MSVERRRDPDRPNVAHVRLDAGDLNLFTAETASSFRRAVGSTPEEVSVLTVAAEGHADGGTHEAHEAGAEGAEDEDGGGDVRGLSAGLDLEWASELTPHEGYALLEAFYDAIEAVREVDAVTVCGCGDYTLGVGFELALACEFRVATDDAVLGLPEVDVGLPTVIHGGLLLRLVGEGVANELIYTGETVPGSRAAELGLVTRAVDAAEYAGAFDDLVSMLAAKSPLTLRLQKRVMRRFRSAGLESGMAASVGDAGRAFGSHDQREAMAAFLEDREPSFEGH
jgi:enoyl-CoA hydratase